jgi:hypothetical protein
MKPTRRRGRHGVRRGAAVNSHSEDVAACGNQRAGVKTVGAFSFPGTQDSAQT